ncbi:outer membrane protein assembly factor BamB family protein [Asticcacaulis biprosthecium]|nr:PQQ-like beta-propeller repeat protein [Asticcacaulis biprosthecium]
MMSLSNRLAKRSAKGAAVLALVVASGLALQGCSTISKITKREDPENQAVASQGQRISIVAFDQKLTPSKSLKDVGYYLPPAATVASWPLAGGPVQSVQHSNAAVNFQVAWSKSIGAAGKTHTEVVAQPVSDGQRIYTLDGQARVTAFDVASGAEVWSVDLDPKLKRDKHGFGGGLALTTDGKLFVTSGYRSINALDAASGAIIWQKPVDTQFHAAPTVDGTHVFATDVDNQIFAFDQVNGEMKWTYQAIAEPARILKSASPVVSGDMVIAPFSSGELVALSTSTGDPVWEQTLAQSARTNALSQIRDIAGRPALYDNMVYAASHSGVFAAMDARSGQTKWQVPADSVNSPWVAGDVVFLTSLQGELMAVSRDSGQIYWIKDLNDGKQRMKKGFFGMGREKLVGKVPQWTGPILASNRLIMVNSDGQAVSYDPNTGAATGELKLGGAAYIAPIVVGDTLFVVTDDGKLVAIR